MKSFLLNYPGEDEIRRSFSGFSLSADYDFNIKPVSAGRNITILPAGNRLDMSDDRITLYLDSSNAFGDGSHPTTILCLALIEEYLESLTSSERGEISMLDIGTGTGVLAILGSVMGAGRITALDLDPFAISSAVELADINRVSNIDFHVMDAALLPPMGEFGVITANLLPPILRTVIPLSAKLAHQGAPVIVSGIGDASRGEMEAVMAESGFAVIKHINSGWWHAYLLKHR